MGRADHAKDRWAQRGELGIKKPAIGQRRSATQRRGPKGNPLLYLPATLSVCGFRCKLGVLLGSPFTIRECPARQPYDLWSCGGLLSASQTPIGCSRSNTTASAP